MVLLSSRGEHFVTTMADSLLLFTERTRIVLRCSLAKKIHFKLQQKVDPPHHVERALLLSFILSLLFSLKSHIYRLIPFSHDVGVAIPDSNFLRSKHILVDQ